MRQPQQVLRQELKTTSELKPELKEQKPLEKVFGGFRKGMKESLFAKLEKQRELLRTKRLPVIIQRGVTIQRRELKKVKQKPTSLLKQEFDYTALSRAELGKSKFDLSKGKLEGFDVSRRFKRKFTEKEEYPLVEPEFIYFRRPKRIGYMPKLPQPEILDVKGKVTHLFKEKDLQRIRPSVALKSELLAKQNQGLFLLASQKGLLSSQEKMLGLTQIQGQKQQQTQIQNSLQKSLQKQDQLQSQILKRAQEEKSILKLFPVKPTPSRPKIDIPFKTPTPKVPPIKIPKIKIPEPKRPQPPRTPKIPENPPSSIPKFNFKTKFYRGLKQPKLKQPSKTKKQGYTPTLAGLFAKPLTKMPTGKEMFSGLEIRPAVKFK